MRITNIQNGLYNRNLSFQRKLREDEKAKYQKDIEAGFEAAGVKKRIAITHGSVFPAVDRDTFMGSPYGTAAKKYIEFLKLHGFNGNQLGPNGALSENNISPYNASALNENRLFLDLKALTTDKYGKILTEETYKNITAPITTSNKNYALADFEQANYTYTQAIKESYKNFKINLSKNQPEAFRLNRDFKHYLKINGKKTEEEGVYKILSALHETDDHEKWGSEYDANLMTLIRNGDKKAKRRYDKIVKNFHSNIEEYQFEQFLLTKQIKENKEFRNSIGFDYYSDFLVGCSMMDKWRYKEAFLDGYSIGAFEYDDRTPHQLWGIPVLNPRMLFNDNELNIGGIFLKEKIDHALEYCENTRIDHALGLIDPFIYKESTAKKGIENKRNIHCGFMSELNDTDGNKLDDYNSYKRILRKIILPALKEHGLEKHDAVWEDICYETNAFRQIYRDELKLPYLRQLEFYRAQDGNTRDWYLVGSHDSIPVMNMLRDDGGRRRYAPTWQATYLSGYLHQDANRLDENIKFCESIADTVNGIPKKGEALEKADRNMVIAKFAELFTKEKTQVSFADIFGINDKNIVYNIGGSSNKINWKERIAPDFEDKYYKNLSSDKPTALNIPEVLGISVRAKMDMIINSSENKDETREKIYQQYQPLLDKLNHWANVLKEKE